MAEIEKDINLLEETPVGSEDINEEVNVEIEGDGEETVSVDETISEVEEHYKNIAEDMDERDLKRMASSLVAEYKKDVIYQ